jgi:hypothetical protein
MTRLPHTLDHVVVRILAKVQAELAGLDLGDVEYGVNEPLQVLAVGTDACKSIQRFRTLRFIEAFLHKLGIAEDGGERSPEFVAHVSDEL